MYVDDTYKNGNINNVLGTTKELCYDINNPENVSEKNKYKDLLPIGTVVIMKEGE